MAAAGDMASNMASVLVPMAAGRAVGKPVVQAAQEGLLGLSMTPEAAALRQFGVGDEGGVRLPGGSGMDPATARGQEIMGMLTSGRAGEVTDQMLDLGDPVLNTRLNEYLYSNYDLPMDTASRMGRAQEMGFSNAYHGTGSNIAAVDPTYFGSGQDLLGSGFYTTTNPMRADRYVPREKTPNIEVSKEYGTGGNIIPLMVREPNAFRLDQPLGSAAEDIAASYAADPFFSVDRLSSGAIYVKDLDGKGFLLDPAQPRHWTVQNMRKTFGPSDTSNVLSEIGYSGIAGPEAAGQTVRASYNPADIRSIFARFDPRLSHLRNLNAALTAGVPLGLLAMQPEQEQY
jgi:hypothetical protein